MAVNRIGHHNVRTAAVSFAIAQLRRAAELKHISKDMRMVFDALGYPTGRVLATPAGHNEEWWYYGELAPPLRFRDGALIDTDEFEALLSR